MKITILGCAVSYGVPKIGNIWGKCNPNNPKNKRTRSSIFIEEDNKNILIDTSQDLYHQFIREGISRVDAVLWTHHHADHVHGINDLSGTESRPIQCYASKNSCDEILKSFSYCFSSVMGYKSFCNLNVISSSQDGLLDSFVFMGVKIVPILQSHGRINSVGFRIGDFAYNVDFNGISEENINLLKGIKLWVVESLSHNRNYSHINFERMLEIKEIIRPERTVLVNLNNQLDYDILSSKLPNGIEVGYDGMILEV